MRFEFHSVGSWLISEADAAGRFPDGMPAAYRHCRDKLDATLMNAYEKSATFRRLFNHAWETQLQYPGQSWHLDALGETAEGAAETRRAISPDERVISLRTQIPHLAGVSTYTSDQGEQDLDWDRACLHTVIRALTSLSPERDEGHPRGAVIEYTNNVLKEMGCQHPPCTLSTLYVTKSLPVEPIPRGTMRQRRSRMGLRLDFSKVVSPVTPEETGALSVRQQRKMPEAVARALARTNSASLPAAAVDVSRHLHRAQQYIDDQLQPDKEILENDSATVAQILDAENARKPDLHLTVCESIAEVIARVGSDQSPSHQRIIFRDPDAGLHYSFADICAQQGHPTSILLFESADLVSATAYSLYRKFAREIRLAPCLSDANVSIIDVNVQRSPADCLIFGLSFALKSHKHADLLMRWHKMQQASGHVTRPVIAMPVVEPKAELYAEMGLHLYPSSMLPVDFIKHTHSREVIGKRLDLLEAGEGQTRAMLTQKIAAAERRLADGGERNYLPSIEYKRRDLLARTLNSMTGDGRQAAGTAMKSWSVPVNVETRRKWSETADRMEMS